MTLRCLQKIPSLLLLCLPVRALKTQRPLFCWAALYLSVHVRHARYKASVSYFGGSGSGGRPSRQEWARVPYCMLNIREFINCSHHLKFRIRQKQITFWFYMPVKQKTYFMFSFYMLRHVYVWDQPSQSPDHNIIENVGWDLNICKDFSSSRSIHSELELFNKEETFFSHGQSCR